MTLRQEFDELERKLSTEFSTLIHGQDEIVLHSEEDIENGDLPDDYFDYRNDVTGNVIEIHILKITPDGIHCIEAQDNTKKHNIRFSHLATTYDRVNLCEVIEAKNKF